MLVVAPPMLVELLADLHHPEVVAVVLLAFQKQESPADLSAEPHREDHHFPHPLVEVVPTLDLPPEQLVEEVEATAYH